MDKKFFLLSKGFWGVALAIVLEMLEAVNYSLPLLTSQQQDLAALAALALAAVGRIVATKPLALKPKQ